MQLSWLGKSVQNCSLCVCIDCDCKCRYLLLTCKRFLSIYMCEGALWRKISLDFTCLAIWDEDEDDAVPRPFVEQDRYLHSKLRLLWRVAGGGSDSDCCMSLKNNSAFAPRPAFSLVCRHG